LDEKPARSFVLRAADNQDNQDNQLDIIVWRHDGEIRAYVNQCPHLKVPLETFPDRFLTRNGKALICSAHGAQFAPSGRCFIGPCEGDALTTIAIVNPYHWGRVRCRIIRQTPHKNSYTGQPNAITLFSAY
jgi:nitrite reductase/ring-hydroxylating ferredoxin subunit